MTNINSLPLAAANWLSSVKKGDRNRILTFSKANGYMVRIFSENEYCTCYFHLISTRMEHGKSLFEISLLPRSENNNREFRQFVAFEDMQSRFEKWFGIAQSFRNIEDIFEDNVFSNYREAFEDMFNTESEENKNSYFTSEERKVFSNTLERTKQKLLEYRGKIREDKIADVDGSIKDIDLIIEALPYESKSSIGKKLSKFFARIKAINYQDLTKDILVSFAVDELKEGMKLVYKIFIGN
jgi:hypothetical protein